MSFEIVQSGPNFFGLGAIREEALPKAVIRTENLVHGFPMPVEVVLGRKTIPPTWTVGDRTEVLWLVASKVLFQLSWGLERCLALGAPVR